jgi:hypothetical protein
MDKSALKDMMYGGIKELMQNRNFYYTSSINIKYSRWTDKGQEALMDYLEILGHKMLEIDLEELDERAKDMVLRELRGENE